MYAMIERFLQLEIEIKKATIDIGESFDLSTNEMKALKILSEALEPVKIIAEKLFTRKVDLLSIEPLFAFLFDELKKLDSHLATEIYESAKSRILKRTNNEILSIALYLKYGKQYQSRMQSIGVHL